MLVWVNEPLHSTGTPAGYKPRAGSINNPCGHLRSLRLMDYPVPGYVRVESVLFLAG